MRIQVRAAVAAITTTLIIYTIGWGPMIVIGYALGIADVIHAEGSDAWWPATLWALLGVVAGQILHRDRHRADDAARRRRQRGRARRTSSAPRSCCACSPPRRRAAKEAQAELHRQANTDALTGLANRAAITRALESRVHTNQVSVMFVDLDGFKEVNDRLGHERGDAVLVEAADRIATSLGRQGTVGRLGGDEFLVLLPALPDRELVAARRPDPRPPERAVARGRLRSRRQHRHRHRVGLRDRRPAARPGRHRDVRRQELRPGPLAHRGLRRLR